MFLVYFLFQYRSDVSPKEANQDVRNISMNLYNLLYRYTMPPKPVGHEPASPIQLRSGESPLTVQLLTLLTQQLVYKVSRQPNSN